MAAKVNLPRPLAEPIFICLIKAVEVFLQNLLRLTMLAGGNSFFSGFGGGSWEICLRRRFWRKPENSIFDFAPWLQACATVFLCLGIYSSFAL